MRTRVALHAIAVSVVLIFCAIGARADVKQEMLDTMDRLCDGAPDAESTIDWDNLTVTAPQLKGMDVHKLYTGMDATNRAGFRAGFLKSLAASFKQQAKGMKFSVAAKRPGAAKYDLQGAHPSMTLYRTPGNPALKVRYVRKHGKLLIDQIVMLSQQHVA